MSEIPSSGEATPLIQIPLLTDVEKQALFDSPNHGIQQAELYQFGSVDDWARSLSRSNNFWLFFYVGSVASVKREMQCAQRFSVLYPELDERLCEIISVPTAERPDFSTEHVELLFEAYQKMSELVAVDDLYVRFHPDDELPDPIILLR